MASTPSDSWYYLVGERPVGPLTTEQMRAAVAAGTVRPETLVRNSTSSQWCQLAQVPGLSPIRMALPPGFPGSGPAPTAAPPPKSAPSPAASAPPTVAAPAGQPAVAMPQASPATAPQPVAPPSLPPTVVPAQPPIVSAPAQASPASQPVFTVSIAATPSEPPPSASAQPQQPVEPSVPVASQPAAEAPYVAASRPQKAAPVKRRRKGPPVGLFIAFLAVVAGGIVAALYLSNTPWFMRQEPTLTKKIEEPKEPPKPKEEPKPKEADTPKLFLPEVDLDPNARLNFSRTPFEQSEPAVPRGHIDELVFAKWKELGIEPAYPCTDAVFLRRVYLDVLGTLPTAKEARAFLEDKSPDKRAKLIDALLERPEFADFLAMKWSDLLRVKAEFPINLWPNAAQAYHRWIRNAIKTNMPYDRFVRELLTSSGSNFRVPQVNFYRALQSKDPSGIARAVAISFMGTRADKWPPERLAGMAAFFRNVGYKPTGEWKEEIVVYDPHKTEPPLKADAPKPGTMKAAEKRAADKKAAEKKAAEKKAGEKPKPAPADPVLPDGTPVELEWGKDPRGVFADWLISPKNPWFTRHIANRVWYWLIGRGIVHEPDDIRPDNPPSNPALLNWLAEELVKANYDLKHLYRVILNSSAYQLSSLPKSKHPEAAVHFAACAVRRLEAEVIIDALNQITGTTESYSSIIPEPYTFIPETRRAICLPDGSITSSFLELFGRPPRDSGLESERNNRITAGQRLHLLNSSHVRNKLREGPGLKKLMQDGNARENLYLAILSRMPGDGEHGSGEELAWTLINTTEFLFRH